MSFAVDPEDAKIAWRTYALGMRELLHDVVMGRGHKTPTLHAMNRAKRQLREMGEPIDMPLEET